MAQVSVRFCHFGCAFSFVLHVLRVYHLCPGSCLPAQSRSLPSRDTGGRRQQWWQVAEWVSGWDGCPWPAWVC